MTFRRARRGAVETCTRIPAARVRKSTGCKNAFDQLLFPRVPLRYALPGRSWRLVPHRAESLSPSRRGRCPHRPVVPAPARDSQRQRKEKKLNAMTTPTSSTPSATGRQSQESQKGLACPKARRNRRRHRYAAPRRARRATAPERVKAAFSFGPCNCAAVGGFAAYGCGIPLAGTARFLFGQDRKGPPPRPARWGEEERPSPRSGRGSALGVQGSGRSFRRRRKRSLADFATTTMGGASRWTSPLREQTPPRPPSGGPHIPHGTAIETKREDPERVLPHVIPWKRITSSPACHCIWPKTFHS